MPRDMPDTKGASILIVDDDDLIRISLQDRLRMEGFETFAAGDIASARDLLAARFFDLVVTDIRLPDGDGRELFEEICRLNPGSSVILMTAYISVEDAVALTKAGAIDYLTKPFDLDIFVAKARRAVERLRDLRAAPLVGPDGSAAPAGSGILGKSASMRRIENIAARVRDVDASVLLTGESGVGKEVVAHFLHRNSARAERPFVVVDCASLPEGMVEYELFGFEQGAFAGADRRHPGRFEQAQRGTIFIDEVADIPLATQVKLLRVLQDREVQPLGGTAPVKLDVRVIAASQVNLEEAVSAGHFRADLYWRLNVIHIPIPPLNRRPDDILFLARRFVAEQAALMGRPILGLSAAAESWLLQRDYPGNVRELRNMIERAVALSSGPRLQEYDLKAENPVDAEAEAMPPNLDLKTKVEEAERLAILRAIEAANGVLQDAAALLGVSRKTLWDKMRRYGLGQT